MSRGDDIRGPYTAPASSPPAVDVLGLKVQSHTPLELNAIIGRIVRTGGHAIVPNVNVHFANLAWRRPWLREFFNSAPVNFCDGDGIRLGARLLGCRIAQRITYGDWLYSLAAYCRDEGIRLYFLGGRPGVATAAAHRLMELFPGLAITGTGHGYFAKEAHDPENAAVVREVNRCRPDVLLVAFGMPLQEQWLRENWHGIDARVGLTGGAALDYVSGQARRPPAWLRRLGCEWLGRLLIEPRRLWKRYLIGNPLFLARVLRQRLRPRR